MAIYFNKTIKVYALYELSQYAFKRILNFNAVSGAGEPPPCALSDTDVNLSAHPAPIIQPSVLCPTANAEITRAAFWQFFPTKKPHSLDGLSTFSISSLPI